MSDVDQKRAFNKLKHDLEKWRELILVINSVLKWEKPYYAGIIFGTITTIFMFLWYLDYSMLTLICLFLLNAVLFDYFYPIISKFIFKPDNWTGLQESKFEEVCNQLSILKRRLYSCYEILFTAKDQKTTIFVIGISLALVVGAYIGAVVDNLFLSYMAVLFVSLFPGINKTGTFSHLKNQIAVKIKSKLQKTNEVKMD